MKRVLLAATAVASVSASSLASGIALKRVVLSTAGLGQFTYAGEIAAGKSVELTVRLDQVDDILKSLTMFDVAGGVGAVSLPGKTPLAELFRDLPFEQEALQSQPALLNALVGAEIEIEGEVAAAGRVFHVDEETIRLPGGGGEIKKHRLTLLTDKGFVQAILEDLRALRFSDPTTRAQIERALLGLAENRAKDQRTLSIAFSGEGRRPVALSYVVAAPVWKTSYRLVLPKEGGKARLQAWGVLENMTGGNWTDVELTLVSGNPIALKQPLYTAFFANRPEIPVVSSRRVLPKTDDAVESQGEADLPRPAAAALPAAPPLAPAGAHRTAKGYAPDGSNRMQEPIAAVAKEVEGEETATQVLFRFPNKVTLASGSTLMIPFADREIRAERTYLYQPETDRTRPLAALRLTNDGETALPPGVLTTFDTSADGGVNFAGDAQLPLLARGATRFVTFALDGKTEIKRFDRGTGQVRLGKAVRGELTVTTRSTWAIDYEIAPPAEEDRAIVIDEARADGWNIVGDRANIEEAPSRVRLKVAAPRGKTLKTSLVRERIDFQTVHLSTMTPDRLLAVVSGLENDAPALSATLSKLAAIVEAINGIDAKCRELDVERKHIYEDQDRIRKNLASVGQGSDLGRRYLDALKAQEDRLSAIAAEERALREDGMAKDKAARDLAEALTL